MKSIAPSDILQMPFLAAAYEADWRSLATLGILATMVFSAGRMEVLEAYEPPPARRIARDRLANKPPREHRRLDSKRPLLRVTMINRRRA